MDNIKHELNLEDLNLKIFVEDEILTLAKKNYTASGEQIQISLP
jgi:hypothetical protein